MIIRFSFIAMLVALAGTTYAAGPTGLGGIITKVDSDAKSFTVKAKEGETFIKYDDKTKFATVKPAEANILTDGCQVKVNGKFSEDETVVNATGMERLSDSSKWNVINAKEFHCVGIFHRKDDAMTVTVGDKTITIKPAEKMKYGNRVNSSDGDLEEGKAVWISVVPVENSGKRLAQSIVITTPANTTPAKPVKQATISSNRQPAAPPATAPTVANEKQPTGPISGTVTEVAVQDFVLKVAKDGDAKRVLVYNMTVLTEIFVAGKAAKFDDIKKGMKITVVSSDGKAADRIDAGGELPPVTPTPKKPKK